MLALLAQKRLRCATRSSPLGIFVARLINVFVLGATVPMVVVEMGGGSGRGAWVV